MSPAGCPAYKLNVATDDVMHFLWVLSADPKGESFLGVPI